MIRYKTLTLPSVANYGGLLQAYALQCSLYRMGILSEYIDFQHKEVGRGAVTMVRRKKLLQWWECIKIYLGIGYEPLPFYIRARLFYRFRKQFPRRFMLDLERRNIKNIPAETGFIVGSDQVWRCEYSRSFENVPFFFLSFATRKQRQRSIAYAASFGSDKWEGTPEETEECARLLKDFKAVSVREHSGIRLCREMFGVDAVQMPDPTLLLDPEDYTRIISRAWNHHLFKPFISVYLLDETDKNTILAQTVATELKLYLQQLTDHIYAPRAMDRIPLSVPQWLRCMRDSECVLTDSFHGCVFAIIFNKPFVCLGNEDRGTARFDSLLSTFGLQERLITNPTMEQVVQRMREPIDWERVNTIRHSEQQRAFDFLNQHLEKN